MKKQISDGWHELIPGISIQTENGIITHVVKDGKPAWIYRWDARLNCHNNVGSIKWDTFRKGWREDRYEIM